MRDFVQMELVPGTLPIKIEEGQTVLVDYEGIKLPMKVLFIYRDGTFDGQVDWEET